MPRPAFAGPLLLLIGALPLLASNVVTNPDMSEGTDRPAGWKFWRDTRHGRVELKSDLEVFKSAPASLRLSSLGATVNASASTPLVLPAETSAVLVRASARLTGPAPRDCVIAIQSFDGTDQQIGWATVAPLVPSGEWLEYEAKVRVPRRAVSVRLLVTFKGEGSVWLDDVFVEPASGDH